jgi:membrane protein DedA with SNARE-associated domain
MDLQQIIAQFSYVAIFGLMTANGLFSFPSSQILYIVVGYFVGTGELALIPAIILGALGNTIGNVALYEIARKHGVKASLAYLPLTQDHITRLERYFARKGLLYLFLAKLTPALKVFVPVAAGIAKTPRIPLAIILFTTSVIWAGAFVAIGYYFGASADTWKKYSVALLFIAVFVTIFAYRGFQNEKTQ